MNDNYRLIDDMIFLLQLDYTHTCTVNGQMGKAVHVHEYNINAWHCNELEQSYVDVCYIHCI